MGARGSFFGVKRPGPEADQTPSSSADVKNAWIYTTTPQYALNGVVLSKKKSTGTTLPLPFTERKIL
jgi:hypothetical protein